MKHRDMEQGKQSNKSPPARGRGLKPAVAVLHHLSCQVAPCAGAWIETVGDV